MTRLPVDGVTLYYESEGTGPPIVFVHGGWMDGEMWTPQVERFAGSHRTITYDVRGHGRTGGSEEPTYSIDLLVEDLRALIESLSLDAPILCGLSLGGMIAQTYANRYPDSVRALVLAGAMRSFPPLPITRIQQEVVFPRVPLYTSMWLLGSRSSFRLILQGIRLAQGHPWIALDDRARRYAFEAVGRLDTAEFIKIFDAMYEFDTRGDLEITAPTLVLTGDHEAVPVVQQSDRLAEVIETASRTTIPDAAHLSNLDNPEAFNDALERFLSTIE